MSAASLVQPRAPSGCPYLSVLTVAGDSLAPLLRKAEALRAQTLPPDRLEWVVCVAGEDAGPLEALRALELPFTLRAFQAGGRLPLGAARNACAERTCGGVLLFSDGEPHPAPERLAAHVALQEAGLCVALGAYRAGARPSWRRPFRRGARLASRGGDWSVAGTIFRAVGGFDGTIGEREPLERAFERRLARAGVPFRRLHDVSGRRRGVPGGAARRGDESMEETA